VWGALTHPGLWNRPVCSRIKFTHPTGEILTPGGLSIRLRSPNREVVSFDAVAGPSRVWMTEAAVNNLLKIEWSELRRLVDAERPRQT